jgi:hypothetical protein
MASVNDCSETSSAQTQATLPIVAFGAAGDMPKLNAALTQGLEVGLAICDAKEVIVQLYVFAGFPRRLNARTEFMKVLDERRNRHINNSSGREPHHAFHKKNGLRTVGTGNQTKLIGKPAHGPVFEFTPAIEYLQTHPFGDIFGGTTSTGKKANFLS